MTQRKYKTKWHRYCSTIGHIITALGGLFMLFYGAVALINQNIPDPFFLASFIQLESSFLFLFSIISIILGILILVISIKQNPHQKETMTWMVLALLLGVVGGTLGGLITLGGTLIYIIFYFL
jgi:hypothetical protein